jgi:hypothetical protein
MSTSDPDGPIVKRFHGGAAGLLLALLALPASLALGASGEKPVERAYVTAPNAPISQSTEQMEAKSAGCVTCHTQTDEKTMHANPAVKLGCTDCHGGDATARRTSGDSSADPDYLAVMERAHVLPRYPESWNYPSSANPERTYTLLNNESPEFTRFINPGDLPHCPMRPAAPATCRSSRPRAQPDGHLGHALGRRGLQQRHSALQALHHGRGLHREGEPAMIPLAPSSRPRR